MKYTVYFNAGGYTWITQEEMGLLIDSLSADKSYIYFLSTRTIPLYINLLLVTHIEGYEEVPANSDVITPPSPAELREEKQREEDSKDVSLDAQLKAVE